MFRNYLKVAIRNIKKNKIYSAINIVGLAIGMASALMITLYVIHEKSFDEFHENSDNIYRVVVKASIGDTKIGQTYTPAILTPTLLDNYPEVEKSIRFANYNKGCIVKYDEQTFNEQKVALVDSEIFDIFTLPFIKGNPKTALKEPNTAVISETTAKKYFGNENPINKIIRVDEYDCKITGIMRDIPINSHFHFSILVSLYTNNRYKNTHWFANNFHTYILLKEGVSQASFDAKLPEFVRTYLFQNYEEWESKGNFWEYYLQPIKDIHLNSDLNGEFEANGNSNYVSMFTIIGIFIILIASINYMNLSTARLSGRAREVGIRKVVGSSKFLLMRQFLTESVLLSFLSLILALFILHLTLPMFSNLVGVAELSIPYFDYHLFLPFLIGFTLLIGVLSGSYPAIYLSSIGSISALSGKGIKGSKNKWLRNGLVLLQFTISIFLLFGTLIVDNQLDYLQSKNIGLDKEQVVVIKTPLSLEQRSEPFKDALRENSSVFSVAGAHNFPGIGFNNIGFKAEGLEDGITLNLFLSDYDFMKTIKLEIESGRFFSKDFQTDTSGIILNEAAAELLGWEDPLSMHLSPHNDHQYSVIGVVKDFHYESLHQTVRPAAILLRTGYFEWSERYIAVRIETGNISSTLEYINNEWDKFSSDVPFEYSFLNDEFDKLYHNELRTSQLSSVFSFLAIFVACLGLLGLASYTAELKTKEIGIRKIHGASVGSLILMMEREFTLWVIIANIIAWPVGYYVMNKWLESFAYRIDLSLLEFIISGGLALTIALLTVSFQSFKAASANPIDSLRNE